MKGSKCRIHSNMYNSYMNCKCGKVKMPTMKYHNVLKAHFSLQAHSKHLRVYVKIDLLEQGKVLGIN